MAAAPEQEKPAGHPEVEDRFRKPGELEKLAEQKLEKEHILQKVERDHASATPVTDDTGQVVLTPAQTQQAVITLPLTEEEIKHGLHHKILDSIRWLAEWCVRIAKKAARLGLKVIYRN